MVWGLNQSPHRHYADSLGIEPITPQSLLVVWVWEQSPHRHYWSHPTVTTGCVGLGPVTPPSLMIVWVWDQSPIVTTGCVGLGPQSSTIPTLMVWFLFCFVFVGPQSFHRSNADCVGLGPPVCSLTVWVWVHSQMVPIRAQQTRASARNQSRNRDRAPRASTAKADTTAIGRRQLQEQPSGARDEP